MYCMYMYNVCIQDNLGLERECDWGVPLLHKPTAPALKRTAGGLSRYHSNTCVRKNKVCYGNMYMSIRTCMYMCITF